MKKMLTILILAGLSISTNAQDFKFGNVSKEELAEKVHPLDSSASAAVLYHNEEISFEFDQDDGFSQVREVHERIKIYNKDGYGWATKRVKLYNESSSRHENLSSLKGYTYNLDGDKIKDDKLKKDGIFEEIQNKYWKIESFTMPSVKEGSVIEYVYEIKSPFLAIDDLDFQYTIPVNTLEVSVITPEYFTYNKLLNPKASYIPNFTADKRTRKETITSKTRTSSRSGGGTVKTNFSSSELEFAENILTSHETNIPALKDEPFIDNLNNYRSKLVMELTAIQYPNQGYKSLSTSWDNVTKSIYNNEDFGSQLERRGYFEDDIDALVKDAASPIEKVQLIFDFVKSKVKWNDYYGYTAESGVKKAYKEGVGNVADINLMLVAMLRYADIKANPVLVSTKNNGIPLLPTRSGFNYVICFIEDQDMNILLDATDPKSTFNILPSRVLNWQGRVVKETGSSSWIPLVPNFISNESTSLNVKINPDFSISGKVRNQKSDYLAKIYRDKYLGIADSEYAKIIEKNNPDLIVKSIQVEHEDELEKPVLITYEYDLSDGVELIGDNLYFSPLFFLTTLENPFKSEKRNLPIDLNYPVSDKYMVNIMLPEGYEVESIPESNKYNLKEGSGSFTYLINQNGSFIQLTINLVLNSSYILSEDYEYFRDFFSKIVEKETEQIVLKKS